MRPKGMTTLSKLMLVIAGLFFSGMAAISMAALPRDQLVRQITKDPANDYHVKWSPDGKRLTFDARWNGRPNIFIIFLADGKTKSLSPDGTVDFHPSWSPDGRRIAFSSDRAGNTDIWVKDVKLDPICGGDSMKKKAGIIGFALFALLSAEGNPQRADFPILKGPYLGQKPPGKTAEPFGLGITGLQQNLHSAMVFSPDGNEAYWKPGWNPREPIYTSGLENGRWTAPKVAPFSAPDQGDDSPFFSPDGKKLFFLSRRWGREKPSIWVMGRVREGWSEPKPLPIDAGSAWIHWQLSVDREYNVYFGARIENVGDICVSRYKNGRYLDPEKLGPEVNKAEEYDYSPFVSPDGSVLIFTRNQTPPRLFISYRKKDGTWTEAKELSGTIGSDRSQNPFLTADGKYLFFTIGGRIQWVDAGFIEELRPKE